MVLKLLGAALVMTLSGCATLPRSAALQSEILEVEVETDGSGEVVPGTLPEFAVAEVTRALLPAYAVWPAIGEPRYSWIDRVDQPNQRIIAPGDTVQITIWTSEENGLLVSGNSRSVTFPDMRVSSSGRIFLPYIGQVAIGGMAPETARARIEESYADVSPSTQVQLGFTEGRANTVSLVGGVARPGSYPLPDRDFTVMGLIAEGGGVSAALENPQIRLQRGGDIFGTSVDRLMDSPRLDTTLAGGDIVYLESDDRTFLSLGAAGTQSVHPFDSSDLTALEAMARIGGLNASRANAQGILILRRYPQAAVRPDASGPPNERMIFVVDLTSADGLFSAGEFNIRPDDLVYVTESPLTTTQTIFSLVGSVFGLVNAVSN